MSDESNNGSGQNTEDLPEKNLEDASLAENTDLLKRLQVEYQDLIANPLRFASAMPFEKNSLEWYFCIVGNYIPCSSNKQPILFVKNANFSYNDGFYLGKFLFPGSYPLEPPIVIMLTPSGCFEPGAPIDLKQIGIEEWTQEIKVSQILYGISKFMLNDISNEETKRALAKESAQFKIGDKKTRDEIDQVSSKLNLQWANGYNILLANAAEGIYKRALDKCKHLEENPPTIDELEVIYREKLDNPQPSSIEHFLNMQKNEPDKSEDIKQLENEMRTNLESKKEMNKKFNERIYNEILDLKSGKVQNHREAQERILTLHKAHSQQGVWYGKPEFLKNVFDNMINNNVKSAKIQEELHKKHNELFGNNKKVDYEAVAENTIYINRKFQENNYKEIARLLTYNEIGNQKNAYPIDLQTNLKVTRQAYIPNYINQIKLLLVQKELYIPETHIQIKDVLVNVPPILSIFFEEVVPMLYDNLDELYDEIQNMVKFIKDMQREADFQEISERKTHHVFYEVFGSILSILVKIEKEIFFLKTKIVPKEAYDSNKDPSEEAGKGGDGAVYIINTNMEKVAIKILNPKDNASKYLDNMHKLNHPNIVRVTRCIQQDISESSDFVRGIVMENCLETLSRYIHDPLRYLSRYFYISWAYEMTEGIAYLHSNGIIHRDLKPDNILLNHYGQIKICDLDRANFKERKGDQPISVDGSYRYMAPEFLAPSDLKIPWNEKLDVWSYGVILWEMFSHLKPYKHLSDDHVVLRQMVKKIKNASDDYPKLALLQNTPYALENLIKSSLNFEAGDRPSCESIIKDFRPIAKGILDLEEKAWKEITKQDCGIEVLDQNYKNYTSLSAVKFMKNVDDDKKTMDEEIKNDPN